MMNCDFCGDPIKYQTAAVISWRSKLPVRGEMHFHPACLCHALQQLQTICHAHRELDVLAFPDLPAFKFNYPKREHLNYGIVSVHGATEYNNI